MNKTTKKFAVLLFMLAPTISSCSKSVQDMVLDDYVSLKDCLIQNMTKYAEIGVGKKKSSSESKSIKRKYSYPDNLESLIGKTRSGDYEEIPFTDADGNVLNSTPRLKSFCTYGDFTFFSFANPTDYKNYEDRLSGKLQGESAENNYLRIKHESDDLTMTPLEILDFVLPCFANKNYIPDDSHSYIYSYCLNNKTGKIYPLDYERSSNGDLDGWTYNADSYSYTKEHSGFYNDGVGSNWMISLRHSFQFNESNQLVITKISETSCNGCDKNGIVLVKDNSAIGYFENLKGQKRTISSLGDIAEHCFVNYVTGDFYLGSDYPNEDVDYKYLDKDFSLVDADKSVPVFAGESFVCNNGNSKYFKTNEGLTKITLTAENKYETTKIDWPKNVNEYASLLLYNNCLYYYTSFGKFGKFSMADDAFKTIDLNKGITISKAYIDSTNHLAVIGYDAEANKVIGYINENDEYVETMFISDTYDVSILDPLN